MRKIVFLLVTFFGLISCDQTTTYETVTVDNYSLEIPSYLSKADGLLEEASFQYQNLFKELYIIAIDENKNEVHNSILDNGLEDTYSTNFKGYVELLSDDREQDESINMKNQSQKDTVINGREAKILKFEAKVEGYNIFYAIAYINGVDNYYQITTWTLQSKRKEHEQVMDKMLATFKLKNSKQTNKSAK